MQTRTHANHELCENARAHTQQNHVLHLAPVNLKRDQKHAQARAHKRTTHVRTCTCTHLLSLSLFLFICLSVSLTRTRAHACIHTNTQDPADGALYVLSRWLSVCV